MKRKHRRVKSNPVSSWLRPHLEKSRIVVVSVMAANILVVSMGAVGTPTHAFDYSSPTEQVELVENEVVEVTTKSLYLFPVQDSLGISQHYHALHHGIDIRAPRGSSVVAVDAGVVVEEREQIYGYGKHIRIAHAGTVSSLYAHLDEIQVEVGQKIERGQVIGTVGSTGWSTGSHLHLEIYEAQSTINPKLILNIR